MSTRSTARTLATWAAGALLTSALLPATAAAQMSSSACVSWDQVPYDTAGTLYVEGFLVAQEGAAGVEVFSAAARKFTTVAPPGSSVQGSGDWCLLIREPSTMRAYSSRLNNSAPLPFGVAPIFFDSSDDVAMVVGIDTSGLFTVWAYSAVRGLWVPQPLGAQIGPADYAISRFVVGIRDGNSYHGFSARTGTWSTFAGPVGAQLKADGNTLIADFVPAGGGKVAAFSGVRGCWALSPQMSNPSPLLLDHNTCYIRANVLTPPISFAPCAYSAYRGTWTTSPFVQPHAGVVETISDNVVLVDNSAFGVGLDAFGAGGGSWSALPGPFRPLVVDEDYAISIDPSGSVLGFSGTCTGPWVPEAIPPTPVGPIPIVPPDHIGGVDAGTSLHVFLPAYNSWAPPLAKTFNDVVLAADAVIELVTPGGSRAISTRWGNWVGNPPVSLATAGTGSVIAHQGPGGVIDMFDERCDMWNAPTGLGAPTLMTPGRNLCVFSPVPGGVGPGVYAYSVQRKDWTSPGPIPTPLNVGPIAEENVAALVDAGGALWAYGSPNDGHTYFQWPNGTEYHVSGPTTTAFCKPVLFDYSIRATPGHLSYLLLGNLIQCPPIVLPGYAGELWLPFVGTSVYGFVGVHDADCLIDQKIPLAAPLLPCIQPWFQALTIDPGTFTVSFSCRRSDPAWIF
jgi:hypothetical protein